jgi:outer membrane protein
MRFNRPLGFVLAGLALAAGPSLVRAETLADAIALAYETNPTLQAQRAQLRALDETYVQALSGFRPQVSASGSASWTRTDLGKEYGSEVVSNGNGGYTEVNGGGSYQYNSGIGQITATQPLYKGGRTAAAVQAAQAAVLAGREGLRTVEAQILQSVVAAYEDVRLNQQILSIRNDNTAVLRSQLEETKAKFNAGQVTRTDVAQAEAQLASAIALLATAKAQLQISRANYAAVVGQNPGELAVEPALPGLPPGVDEAFDTAEHDNASLRQAQLNEQSSRAKVREAKAANNLTISAQATVGYTGALQPFGTQDFDRNITGEIVVSQPIFTGGTNSSLIRQAMEQNTSDRINIETARRAVVQGVAQAWNTMVGDRASVTANEEQVRAAQVAFDGIRGQYRVGLSTTIDVLIQRQNLESAQLALVQARHDEYVAEANLLSAMGRLEARALVIGAPIYDPAKSFNRVKSKGAVIWEPLVAVLDAVGEPGVGMPEPSAATSPPAPPQGVAMRPAEGPVPAEAALSTSAPTAPHP